MIPNGFVIVGLYACLGFYIALALIWIGISYVRNKGYFTKNKAYDIEMPMTEKPGAKPNNGESSDNKENEEKKEENTVKVENKPPPKKRLKSLDTFRGYYYIQVASTRRFRNKTVS